MIRSDAPQQGDTGMDPALAAELGSPLSAAILARDREVLATVDRAVGRNDVTLAYQPVVDAADLSRVAFHEALARVVDSNGRVLPAADFIRQIEQRETGRMLDCRVLSLGLAQLRDNPGLRLAINMSARSIGYRPWTDLLARGLTRDPTLGERLILEISEASAMLMPEIVVRFMRDLRHRGVTFALDDFGAGFTSFRHLRAFLFDIVKIDGEFIRGIATNPDNEVLTGALISFARQLDMFTVAESVEEASDAMLLRRMGVNWLQGYHIGTPVIRAPWHARREERSA